MDPLALFGSLRQHRHGAQRAPHKPLLLLCALARLLRGEARLAGWSGYRDALSELLTEFGRPGKPPKPGYPFWRLRGDRVWEVEAAEELAAQANRSGDLGIRLLDERNPLAGFPQPIWETLRARPELAWQAVRILLEDNFPPSLHEDILLAVGAPHPEGVREAPGDPAGEGVRRRRDPEFRATVLRIYEHRCAVCGYQGRLGNSSLGLEAAHVQWHAHDGPDHEENGLALCAFHHLVFDRGAIALAPRHRILVSQDVHGAGPIDRLILDHHGQRLLGPQPGTPAVAERYARWHRREVFREPARAPA